MKSSLRKLSFGTSLAVLIVCLVLVTGSTFSLFTSNAGTNIGVTSATVALTAEISQNSLTLFSKDVKQESKTNFENGGTATLENKGATLKLDNITPGDRAEFKIVVTNDSTVDIQYRVNWFVEGALAEGLKVTVDGTKLVNGTSEWTKWAPSENEDEKTKTISVSVELPLEAGDKYQNKTAEISFSVEAVQANGTYDYTAYVSSAAGLQAAFNSGASEIVLNNDVELTETVEIPAGATVALNLNGKTVTASVVKDEEAVLINKGNMTVIGGSIENNESNGAAVISNEGTMVLKDVSVTGAPIVSGGYPEYAVINVGKLTIEEGTEISGDRGAVRINAAGSTVINGGTFTVNDIDVNLTNHVICLSDDTVGEHILTINGGTFVHNYAETSGGVVVCNQTKNTVYVNGGSFSGGNYYGNDNLSDYGYGGTFEVTGGTFSAKPADSYVAEGYHALSLNGKYVVLSEDLDAADTATLIDLIKNAPVGETTEIVLADGTYSGDIAITLAALGQQGGDVVIKAADGAEVIFTGTTTLGLYQNKTTNVAKYDANVTFEGITFDHAENGKHCIDVQNVNSLTLNNCKIIGDGEYGIGSASGNPISNECKIEYCTIENAGLQLYGNFSSNLVIDNCEFVESVINVAAGGDNGPEIKNSKFSLTLTDAHNSDSFYVIRNSNAGANINVENCDIKVDSAMTFEGTAGSKGWGVFVNRIASYDITVNNVRITMTDAALAQPALNVATCLSTGKINMTDVTVNGALYVEDTDALSAAISAGTEAVWIAEGAELTGWGRTVISNDLTIYGNGASITSAEEDFAIEFHNGQNFAFTDDVTLTIYDLNDVTVWGSRCSEYAFNLNLYNCDDCRIFIMGTSGDNNIYMSNCTVTRDGIGQDTAVYSNANGSIVAENCKFVGIECPFNLNHKVAGEMTVKVIGCEFIDCATTGTAGYYAPIRLCNNTEGANQTVTVSGCTFTYSEGKASVNGADVLLNADGVGTNDKGTITASVQDDATVKSGVNVTLN